MDDGFYVRSHRNEEQFEKGHRSRPPFVAVLHCKAIIELKTEKFSEALGVTRAHTLRNCLKVQKKQHLLVICEKFVKSPRN